MGAFAKKVHYDLQVKIVQAHRLLARTAPARTDARPDLEALTLSCCAVAQYQARQESRSMAMSMQAGPPPPQYMQQGANSSSA